MAIVIRTSQRWRIWCAHAALLVFIAFLLFPFLMIVSISLRPGNFAGGHLIPQSISLEHWKVALGMSYVDADGTLVKPPFPILTWILNSLKVSFGFLLATISCPIDCLSSCSRTARAASKSPIVICGVIEAFAP